jgi:hypothetical protein
MATNSASTPIEDEYAWVFFGRSSEYYLQLWKLRQQGKYIHFSAAAFFLGFFWLAYRRMYFVIFLCLLALVGESLIEQSVLGEKPEQSQGLNIALGFIHASLLGIFGNAFYLWDAERKMRKVLRQQLPKDETITRLRKAGGTSWWFLPVFLLLAGAYLWLLKWLSQQPTL